MIKKSFEKIIPSVDCFEKCKAIVSGQMVDPAPPIKLLLYVIALEDRRFFAHKGFDFYSILRVFFYSLFGLKKGGASTITQQLVRTITNDREITLARKVREIVLSYQLEKLFDKHHLIKSYLNIAYLGSHITGATSFSLKHFNKGIYDLDDDELSLLAASLKYPRPAVPKEDWYINVCRRARYARNKAYEKKWIKKAFLIFLI